MRTPDADTLTDVWQRVVDAVAIHSRHSVGPDNPADDIARYVEDTLADDTGCNCGVEW